MKVINESESTRIFSINDVGCNLICTNDIATYQEEKQLLACRRCFVTETVIKLTASWREGRKTLEEVRKDQIDSTLLFNIENF